MSMIKLAEKSNPDAIPAIEKMKKSTLQNDKSEIDEKKVRDPKTVKPKQFKTKKVAKDDMELAKARKKEIRENLEKNLPKKSKDDMELLRISKEIDKIDFKKMTEADIPKNVQFAKKALDTITSRCEGDSKLLKQVKTANKLINMLTEPESIDIEILINLGKEANGIYEQLNKGVL